MLDSLYGMVGGCATELAELAHRRGTIPPASSIALGCLPIAITCGRYLARAFSVPERSSSLSVGGVLCVRFYTDFVYFDNRAYYVLP